LKGVAFAPVAPSGAPVVITLTASNITAGSATLDASVNPNGAATAYWFQYGPTAGYGSFTATNTLPAGSSPVIVTAALAGLPQGTVYHYQIVATNSVNTGSGSDVTFTTLAVTPPELNGVAINGNLQGGFQFAFTNTPGAVFTVWASTNLALPFTNQWQNLGHPGETPDGSYSSYQFNDTQASNNVMQFYRISSP
jgi:hypothetical protein